MVLQFFGFSPPSADVPGVSLCGEHVDLLLRHESRILQCSDYFFCQHPNTWCSWPLVGGDGPLPVGFLLLGWRARILIDTCSACSGKVLISRFGGPAFDGYYWWHGFCLSCKSPQTGAHANGMYRFRQFVEALRTRFPATRYEWEEVDGQVFSFGGSGLMPGRKKQLTVEPMANPVSFEMLISELSSGALRASNSF